MLKELRIKNFAIIDELHVHFGRGLHVFTGETGAGKSIIIEALSLALGGRASAEMIRSGEEMASIEAAFDLTGQAEMVDLASAHGIDVAGEELVIKRAISASRNRVYVNGTLSTTLWNRLRTWSLEYGRSSPRWIAPKTPTSIGTFIVLAA